MKQWSWQGIAALGLMLAAAIGAWALGAESMATMLGGAAVGGAFVPRVREPEPSHLRDENGYRI